MSSSSAAVGQQGLGASFTIPAPTRAEKDDMNAAMIEHFDPVEMTLPEIEAMQAKLAELAAWRRAEDEGKPEDDPLTDFVSLETRDWAPVGDCMDVNGDGDPVEELEPFDAGEDDWCGLAG